MSSGIRAARLILEDIDRITTVGRRHLSAVARARNCGSRRLSRDCALSRRGIGARRRGFGALENHTATAGLAVRLTLARSGDRARHPDPQRPRLESDGTCGGVAAREQRDTPPPENPEGAGGSIVTRPGEAHRRPDRGGYAGECSPLHSRRCRSTGSPTAFPTSTGTLRAANAVPSLSGVRAAERAARHVLDLARFRVSTRGRRPHLP
jgi:hypothetical protein